MADRRTFVTAIGALITGSIAGCSSNDSNTNRTTEQSPNAETTTETEEISSQSSSQIGTWSMFGYDAANTGYAPDEMGPVDSPTQKWEFNTDAEYTVYTSPAVVDGTVYVSHPTPDESNSAVYAINAASGERRWSKQRAVYSSPAVADETVYCGGNGIFYAFDAATGKERWSTKLKGPSGYRRKVYSSPVIHDGVVYLSGTDGVDGDVYALDAENGEKIWHTPASGYLPPAVADGTVYVRRNGLHALDAESGKVLWQSEHSATGAPAVTNGTVYFGNPDNHVYAIDTESGEVQWNIEISANNLYPIESSPTVTDGLVYIYVEKPNSLLYAFDAETGEQQWNLKTGRLLKPAVVGDTVYIGHGKSLDALNPETGAKRWSYELDSGPAGLMFDGSPAVVDGIVYTGTGDGRVIAVEEG